MAALMNSSNRFPDDFDSALSQASVLIVDDEPGIRNFLTKTLSGPCARVDETADIEEASALLDAYSYDVIVLDLSLIHISEPTRLV